MSQINGQIKVISDKINQINFKIYSLMNQPYINHYYQEYIPEIDYLILIKVIGLDENGYLQFHQVIYNKKEKQLTVCRHSTERMMDDRMEEISNDQYNFSCKSIFDEMKQQLS